MNIFRSERRRSPGKHALKNAILRTFSRPLDDSTREDLQRFSLRDWRQLGTWLHASGLALYFLRELEARSLQAVIPSSIVADLQQNRSDNLDRTDSLFREFVQINEAFRVAQIPFVNVKGFALVPEYCSDPTLRSQFDVDFRTHPRFAHSITSTLRELGYDLVSQTERVLEFKSGEDSFPNVRDFYKPRSQRCVEVHLASEGWLRAARTYQGFTFPAFPDELTFIHQAQHLAKHLKSEWTRAAWILELHNCIDFRRDDQGFWNKVKARSAAKSVALDLGLALLTVSTVFGIALPSVPASFVELLPRGVKRWVHEYALAAILAPFPGTKLYLLLLSELNGGTAPQVRRTLVPFRLPAVRARGNTFRKRITAACSNAHYIAIRFRFHVREGVRYLFAAHRWSKVRANATTHFLSIPQQDGPGA